MSAASNGGGSHFAPAPDSGRAAQGDAGAYDLDSTGAYVSTSSYSGFAFDTPNGSHAAIDPSASVPGARRISPSETDTFVAIAAQMDSQRTSAAESAIGNVSASWSAADSFDPAGRSAAAASAPYGEEQSQRPVNPLVAARAAASSQNAASAGAAGSAVGSDGLFPIQEVDEARRGSVIDLSFAEKGQKRGILTIVLIVLAVALVVAGIFFGLRMKETVDARANIDNAIERLRDSDAVIVPLDTAIAAELSSQTASESLSNLMLQSSTTATALTDAEEYAATAARSSDLLSQEENDAVAAIKSSVGARRSMLEIGRMLLSADTNASEALASLEAAYANIADSNTRIQASAEQFAAYNEALSNGWDTSGYDVWAIVQLDNDALADLTAAQANVAAAREAFSSADLTVLDTYLDVRINQVNLLIQIDSCMANGDYEGANNLSGPYAEADANAQAAAAQVPATAAELLASAYEQVTASQRDAYDAVRSKCVEADATLNAYLGITDVRKEMGMTGENTVSAATAAIPITDQAAPADPAESAEGQPEGGEAGAEVPVEGGEVDPAAA